MPRKKAKDTSTAPTSPTSSHKKSNEAAVTEYHGTTKYGRQCKVKFTDGAWWGFEKVYGFWVPEGDHKTPEAAAKALGIELDGCKKEEG